MPRLRLIGGNGEVLEVLSERNLLGRDASCEVVVQDKSVSRRHALVEKRGNAFWVQDQGSANGIFLDGERVEEGELRHGQEFSLGLVEFRVEIESDAPAAPQGGEAGGTMLIPVAGLAAHQADRAATTPAASGSARASSPAASDPEARASELLGLAPGSPPHVVQARLSELESELQARIARAPNAHLRATYERNLAELREAAGLLAPAAPMTVSAADLPSAQPSVLPASLDEGRPAPARASAPPSAARRPAEVGPPQSAVIAASLTVILIGLSVFFALSANRSRGALSEQKTSSDFQKLVEENRRYIQPPSPGVASTRDLVAAGVLKNGKVTLCNTGAMPIEIRKLGALWLKLEGSELKLEKFSSSQCVAPGQGGPIDVLVAGEKKSVITTGNCRFDGQALFVAVEFGFQRQERSFRLARWVANTEGCLDLDRAAVTPSAGTSEGVADAVP